MWRDDIGARSASRTRTTITARPATAPKFALKSGPELQQRMRRRARLRHDGSVEDFGGHLVYRMRGLISP